ncbi:hypothetical protein BVG16_15310 [Paenibacillus selenitireducens]|uniref:Uncharacterized protein n=1 Tax=Paenibacillus selenitireducens TaxID=1324314 RepID=A0A1T2XDC7_9BACL|nr:hypothetical protein BVG16_15310 [Paenibacillus selenitireducens]
MDIKSQLIGTSRFRAIDMKELVWEAVNNAAHIQEAIAIYMHTIANELDSNSLTKRLRETIFLEIN